ncbi:MAG: glutamyl-tRNA synthetase [Patescibacteria group bacterium]|nr:glutamyl-tRNA synthetase [Patescibacteria group bacterium]
MSSTKTPVRVRFAPSPTGHLHVGGIRSALFNWLWARHNDGKFILRLEDTDRKRLVEGAADQIYASHDALGITPDEGPVQGGPYGPYIQSERLEIYARYATQLLESGALYPCWCTPERLDGLRQEAQKAGTAFKYDRYCLKPGNQLAEAEPHVLRFRIPEVPESIGWDDAVRGRLDFKLADLDDFVAIKADNFPTYHFANVVDDHLMKISHVLRADEWLPSTPKHLLLFQAFDWEPPTYAHLPAVLGPGGGKKLSKRDGAQSVQEYLDEGYLPEALRSFLASLGWNDGTTQEVYTTPELIGRFTLDRVQKSPAKFDKERLTWMNGLLIRQMPLDELLERSRAFLPPEAKHYDAQYLKAVLRLVQERLKFLSELPELTEFFFADPASAEPHEWLPQIIAALEPSDFTEADLETRLRALTTELDTKPGLLFGLIRHAVTGRTAAPGLFETLHVLGHGTTLRRLRNNQF